MDLTNVKVGDELLLVSGESKADIFVTVTRVGRVWLYVSRSSLTFEEHDPFRRTDGVQRSDYGYRSRLTTPEARAVELEHGRLVKELRDAGLELSIRRDRVLTTDQLNRLLAIMNETA
jgi:hypothetical protein